MSIPVLLHTASHVPPVRLVADIIYAKLHIKTFCSSLIF